MPLLLFRKKGSSVHQEISSDFMNARTLAHGVQLIADIDLVPRPYNRFDPDASLWWLVPATEWPAFKYGKLFFTSDPHAIPGSRDGFYCGFNIEKGLGVSAKDIYHHSLIMTNEWLWHKFIRSLPAGFPDMVGNVFLTIYASHIPLERSSLIESPDAFLVARQTFQSSSAVFEVAVKSLRLVETKLNPANPELSAFIKQLSSMNNIGDLQGQLLQFREADWSWIDFYAGVLVPRNAQTLATRDLWISYLKPWSPWLWQ
jgi:hypothetical protein